MKIINKLGIGLKDRFGRSPFINIKTNLLILVVYAALALAIGFYAGIFKTELLRDKIAFLMPFTLLVFPCLLEEFFFRGLLIPRKIFEARLAVKIVFVVVSAILFTLWHPLNAYLFNHGAQPFFYNPYFLVIVFILGVCCGISYILSKSLWVPIFYHWLTVVIWVLLLGGRNLVKEGI